MVIYLLIYISAAVRYFDLICPATYINLNYLKGMIMYNYFLINQTISSSDLPILEEADAKARKRF